MARIKDVPARNPSQRALAQAVLGHAIVFAIGPAGVGKTYGAIALGAALVRSKWAKKLVVARPNLGAGRTSGFLPGTLEEKLRPLMHPVYDALHKITTEDGIPGWVELATFEYMRGCSYENAVVVIDEAQNATFEELEMCLTRLGEGSKMIICGDPAQSDLPGEALPLVLRLLAGDPEFAVVSFTEQDNLRHPLVAKLTHIFAAYKRRAR